MSTERLGTGVGVSDVDDPVSGTVRFVQTPQEVIELTRGDVDSVIGMVRAGTCAFASPLLTNDVGGLITMEGAPTSHLGILSREYRIPCVMSLEPEDDDVVESSVGSETFFEEWGEYLDGREVELHFSAESDVNVRGEVYEVTG